MAGNRREDRTRYGAKQESGNICPAEGKEKDYALPTDYPKEKDPQRYSKVFIVIKDFLSSPSNVQFRHCTVTKLE